MRTLLCCFHNLSIHWQMKNNTHVLWMPVISHRIKTMYIKETSPKWEFIWIIAMNVHFLNISLCLFFNILQCQISSFVSFTFHFLQVSRFHYVPLCSRLFCSDFSCSCSRIFIKRHWSCLSCPWLSNGWIWHTWPVFFLSVAANKILKSLINNQWQNFDNVISFAKCFWALLIPHQRMAHHTLLLHSLSLHVFCMSS